MWNVENPVIFCETISCFVFVVFCFVPNTIFKNGPKRQQVMLGASRDSGPKRLGQVFIWYFYDHYLPLVTNSGWYQKVRRLLIWVENSLQRWTNSTIDIVNWFLNGWKVLHIKRDELWKRDHHRIFFVQVEKKVDLLVPGLCQQRKWSNKYIQCIL